MDNLNASFKSVSKTKENIGTYNQEITLQSPNEKKLNVLDFPVIKYYQSADLITIKKQKKIESPGLIEYLNELGITLKIAQFYFHEVHVYNKNTHEKLRTLGLQNEEEGLELINPFFKGISGTQAISFISGTNPKSGIIHIFKDSMDFLAFLSKLGSKNILVDAIILHANKCVEQINPYIQEYGYTKMYSWMNNDDEGAKLTQYLDELSKKENGLRHLPRNKLYAPCKNVLLWYQQQILNSQ